MGNGSRGRWWGLCALLAVAAVVAYMSILGAGPALAGATVSSENVVSTANVQYLCDLTFGQSSISLGATSTDSGVATSSQETVFNSNGNLNAYLYLSGYQWSESGGNTLSVQYTIWNPSSQAVGVGNQLTSVPSNTGIYIPSGSSNTLYFGLNTLTSTSTGSFTQNVLFQDSCPASGTTVNSVATNVVFSVTVTSSCTIQLGSNAIGFGSIAPTHYATTSNQIVDTNTGGSPANILVYGSNWVSGSNNFFVANTLWNPSSAGQDVGNALTLGVPIPADTGIYLPANTGTAQSNSIYFGVHIPGAVPAGVYTQNVVVENWC